MKLWGRLQPCELYSSSFMLVELCALAPQFLDFFLHWVGVVSTAGWSAGQSSVFSTCRSEPPDSGQVDSPPTHSDCRCLSTWFRNMNPAIYSLIDSASNTAADSFVLVFKWFSFYFLITWFHASVGLIGLWFWLVLYNHSWSQEDETKWLRWSPGFDSSSITRLKFLGLSEVDEFPWNV